LTPRALPAAPLLGCTAGKALQPVAAAQFNRLTPGAILGMSTNPYEPPSSAVQDILPTPSRVRPKSIRIAALLLTIASVVAFGREAYWNNDIYVGAALLLSLAVLLLLIFMIFQGKNWARMLLVGLFVLGSIGSVPGMFADFASAPVAAAVSLALYVVQLVALYLLFADPGNSWFTRSHSASSAVV